MFKYLSALVVIVAAAIFLSATHSSASAQSQIVEPTTTTLNQIYQQVSPSVVAISVTVGSRNGRTVGSATGSGFVIDTAGHIVTNNHVVDEATAIEVEFFDGTLASAEIVGLDPASDLAVLQVDPSNVQLFPLSFGDSSALLIGQDVLAIGSPYGQDWTLTTGIVSGLNRIINGLTDFSIGGVIQTDAAINPGNSGGPLLNLNGQLIGVNSQILTESGSNSGIGFAIPSNLVQRVAQELIEDGTVDYSYMGIAGTDVSLSLIQSLNLPSDTRGVVVTDTTNNGPASLAGLQTATINNNNNGNFDIITGVNGVEIKGMNELISILASETKPGDTISLTILRNGSETINLPLTLSSRP